MTGQVIFFVTQNAHCGHFYNYFFLAFGAGLAAGLAAPLATSFLGLFVAGRLLFPYEAAKIFPRLVFLSPFPIVSLF
jgi:hypothetical protein